MMKASQNDNARRQPGEVGTAVTQPLHHTPTQPKPGTQSARLRAADTVFKLRGMGWPVETIETASTNLQDAQLLARLLPSFRSDKAKRAVISALIGMLIAALKDSYYAD